MKTKGEDRTEKRARPTLSSSFVPFFRRPFIHPSKPKGTLTYREHVSLRQTPKSFSRSACNVNERKNRHHPGLVGSLSNWADKTSSRIGVAVAYGKQTNLFCLSAWQLPFHYLVTKAKEERRRQKHLLPRNQIGGKCLSRLTPSIVTT